MQVTPAVRMVAVPETEPMRPQSTNIYLIGTDQVLTIDSGEAIDKFRWMLRGYLAAVERAEIGVAAITHHHFDHSGNLHLLREDLGAQVLVPENGVALLGDRLPPQGYGTLRDGQVIDLDGGLKVRVLATPGHSVDSLCYYIEEDGVLFTGDTLLGVGTTTVHDLGAYRRSLQRLVELPNLRVLCPGHGPLVRDARARLQMYIDHRTMREEQIVAALEGSPRPLTSWEITEALYQDVDARLRRAADNNVRAHLAQLEQDGRVRTQAGKPRRPSAWGRMRADARRRWRQAGIQRGQRLEAEARRLALAQQESPPTEQWKRMPRFVLSRGSEEEHR